MKPNALYGAALLGGSAMLVAMGLTHPTGAHLLTTRAELEEFTPIDQIAHGLAIAGMWLSAVGLAGFTRLLGPTRPGLVAALVAFAIAAMSAVVAATLDGFVVPQLGDRWLSADEANRVVLRNLITFCVTVASALTRVYMILGSAAILLWSLAIRRQRLSRGLPWVGVVAAVAASATFAGGSPMVSVHELLALALIQAVWVVWAGVLMLRAGAPEIPSSA